MKYYEPMQFNAYLYSSKNTVEIYIKIFIGIMGNIFSLLHICILFNEYVLFNFF